MRGGLAGWSSAFRPVLAVGHVSWPRLGSGLNVVQSAHQDQSQAEVADLGQQPVQRRLIRERTSDDRLRAVRPAPRRNCGGGVGQVRRRGPRSPPRPAVSLPSPRTAIAIPSAGRCLFLLARYERPHGLGVTRMCPCGWNLQQGAGPDSAARAGPALASSPFRSPARPQAFLAASASAARFGTVRVRWRSRPAIVPRSGRGCPNPGKTPQPTPWAAPPCPGSARRHCRARRGTAEDSTGMPTFG